jgi:hypothetical protein
MRRLFVTLLVSLVPIQTWADDVPPSFESGNAIYKYLTSKDERDKAFAAGYIIGVADAGSRTSIDGWSFCVPEKAPVDQVVDVVKVWLEIYAQNRHYSARSLVPRALEEAFPCPKK